LFSFSQVLFIDNLEKYRNKMTRNKKVLTRSQRKIKRERSRNKPIRRKTAPPTLSTLLTLKYKIQTAGW